MSKLEIRDLKLHAPGIGNFNSAISVQNTQKTDLSCSFSTPSDTPMCNLFESLSPIYLCRSTPNGTPSAIDFTCESCKWGIEHFANQNSRMRNKCQSVVVESGFKQNTLPESLSIAIVFELDYGWSRSGIGDICELEFP